MSVDPLKSRAGGSASLLFVIAIALATALAGVFCLPPLDRDEARFAQATAQMLETGDFVTVQFQSEERNKKPAGIHWLQAASVSAFSDVAARDIWAYRLPSVAGAVIAAIFTFFAGARLFGREAGLVAGLLIATAPALAGEATIAKTDAMLLATVAAAQFAFIAILSDAREGRAPTWRWPVFFWVAIGAGLLIKGPIILLVVGLTAAVIAARRRTIAGLSRIKPVTGIIILLLMILPWALAIHAATEGRFFAEALGGDMAAKIGAAKESHGGPPGYYLILLPVLLWPAAAMIPAALARAIARRREESFEFLIAWIAPAWLVFELAATKLPHYTLPLYPAIAILAGGFAVAPDSARNGLAMRAGTLLYAAVGAGFAILIAATPRLLEQDSLSRFAFPAAAAIAGATAAAAILYWRGETARAAFLASMASASLAWIILAGLLPHATLLQVATRIEKAVADAGLHPIRDGAPPAILSGYYEPSAVFLLGTETRMGDGRAAADLIARDGGAAIVESREREAFLAKLGELGLDVAETARIEGLNYSNGKRVVISIYRRIEPSGSGA